MCKHVHVLPGAASCPAIWPRVCTRSFYPVCGARCRYLEAEGEMERTYRLKQKDLAREVDVTSASKVGGAAGGSLVGCTGTRHLCAPSALHLVHSVL